MGVEEPSRQPEGVLTQETEGRSEQPTGEELTSCCSGRVGWTRRSSIPVDRTQGLGSTR